MVLPLLLMHIHCLNIRCEPFNSTVHLQNIYGSKQDPSRDIANHYDAQLSSCATYVMEAIMTATKGWSELHEHVHLSLLQVQQRPSRPLQFRPSSEFLNSVPCKVLKANRDIYKPGTAWMVSGFQCKGCHVTIGHP